MMSRLTSGLGRLYRPVARFRFNHFLYFPFPEAVVFKLVNAARKALMAGNLEDVSRILSRLRSVFRDG